MLKILTSEQIRLCDQFTIAHEPVSSVDLMERASRKVFEWLSEKFTADKCFVIMAGNGNNGGDALAIARMLTEAGYKVDKIFQPGSGSLSADCSLNLNRLLEISRIILVKDEQEFLQSILPHHIIVDGLFGSGLNRPVEGKMAELIANINRLPNCKVSIDLPSGLFAWDNLENNGLIIRADYTLSFQLPKLPFLFSENSQFTGKWNVLPIGLDEEFIENQPTDYYFIENKDIAQRIKKRQIFAHKGNFGHAFLVAGSYQKTGAAVLASRGCLRSGVGLLTVHVPQSGYQIMQTAVPEAMLCIDESESGFCQSELMQRYDAIGIGPGIGLKQGIRSAFRRLIQCTKVPIVIDADAINILADTPELPLLLPLNCILTPHPGEFDRLTRKHSTGYERMLSQIEYSKKHGVIIVLKGAYTSITTPDGKVYFNSTGNPGMATAGSGDVLTGIVLSLLAQGYNSIDAAICGVYLHGLAGDIAMSQFGQEALIASDIVDNLGEAFKEIRNNFV